MGSFTEDLNKRIRPFDKGIYENIKRNWDSLAKPLGSLGVLEEDIAKAGMAQDTASPHADRPVLLVFCGDHGVVERGISQSDHTVTDAVAEALGKGESSVNILAERAGIKVAAVDAGMISDTPGGVRDLKAARGTKDITEGAAMTPERFMNALSAGIKTVEEEVRQGADIILVGEMGIGNTTSSSAIAAAVLNTDPDEITGKGAGLTDAGLDRKKQAVKEALAINSPDPADGADVMMKLGGYETAALCGACIGGAIYRVPVILDGVTCLAAALCAVLICPEVREVLIASHTSKEPASGMMLGKLGLSPCIDAGLCLGEGSGAVLFFSLFRQALDLYNSGHTFDVLGIEAYRHL